VDIRTDSFSAEPQERRLGRCKGAFPEICWDSEIKPIASSITILGKLFCPSLVIPSCPGAGRLGVAHRRAGSGMAWKELLLCR